MAHEPEDISAAGAEPKKPAKEILSTREPDLSANDPREVQFDLIHIVRRILRARWWLVAGTLAGLILGLSIAYFSKPYYVAQALFLPPKSGDTVSASSVFGGSEDSDTYLGLLASESVADDVIAHTDLMAAFKLKTLTDARITLSQIANFSVSKNTLIQVSVQSGDPKLAASIANAYLEALYRLNGRMVNSGSSHRSIFFEAQLEQQKRALSDAENDLKNTEERTGVTAPQSEVQANISATAGLQSQIGAEEARLAGLLTGATEQNPQVIQSRSQLAQLRAQLADQVGNTSSRSSGLATGGRLPGVSLEYSQKAREVTIQAAEYDTLVQQYERARLASIDPGPQLQIVDRATVPERKAGPSRRHLVQIWGLAGFFASLAWILGAQPLRTLYRMLRDPQRAGGR